MSDHSQSMDSGAARRDAGVAAVTAAAVDDGHAQFLAVAESVFLAHLATHPAGATLDDALASLQRPPGFRVNSLGSIPLRLARRGVIRCLGARAAVRASRRAGLSRVWGLA